MRVYIIYCNKLQCCVVHLTISVVFATMNKMGNSAIWRNVVAQVQNYSQQQFSALQNICFQTSFLSHKDTAKNRTVICSLYCDYYLQHQPQHCFVALSNNVPIGYVLCCVDANDFAPTMKKAYLPTVKKLNLWQWLTFNYQLKRQAKFVAMGYSAHLHIDILPEFQHQGIGTQLIATLFAHLESLGVDGVHLVCGQSNKSAIKFYQKCGFCQIATMPSCVVMGKKFFSEGAK